MGFRIIVKKIHRRIVRLRLKPIRVFCLHQVCYSFDPLRCFESDWIPEDKFKTEMEKMLDDYSFISLTEAQHKLITDFFRRKNYAVLTFDDGYRSNLPILKWLDAHFVPYTLFLNGN